MLKKLELFTFIGSLLLVALLVSFSPNKHWVAVRASQSTPTASFKWSMPDRFGEKDDDGLIAYHWNRETRTYAPAYVNPTSWIVNFDACASTGGPSGIDSYSLEIGGQQIPKGGVCRFSHLFPTQGTFPVKLVITTHDGQSASAETTVVVKDFLIVSIGDSFASGEGNPDIERHGLKKAVWVDGPCHRSASAGPAVAAMRIERDDPHTSVTFISLACSGAEMPSGVLGVQQKGAVAVRPQLDELVRTVNGRPIDALVISVGGNDAHFGDLVLRAIRLRHCDRDDKTAEVLSSGLAGLPPRFAQVAQRLGSDLHIGKIFITEYPDLVHDQNGDFCDHSPSFPDLLFGINREESVWAADKVIAPLNEMVKAAADLHQWIYVGGIGTQFLKHGFCADDQRWVRTFNDSWKLQGNQFGTVHPNTEGHLVYAARLVEELHSQGVIPAVSP